MGHIFISGQVGVENSQTKLMCQNGHICGVLVGRDAVRNDNVFYMEYVFVSGGRDWWRTSQTQKTHTTSVFLMFEQLCS